MAKKQSFADKNKGKVRDKTVTVKVIKCVKEGNGYKFHETYVKLDDMSKINTIENIID